MRTDERLELFQQMILCCHELHLWTYDSSLNLLQSSYPNVAAVSALFSAEDFREMLLHYAKKHTKPIVMGGELGHMWVAVPERVEGELERIHVLGPFFVDDVSEKEIEARLRRSKLSPTLRQITRDFLRGLPVVSLSRIFEYAIMLYYCLTGEKISVSELHYQESEQPQATSAPEGPSVDVHGTYKMEQEMLRMVREGNLDIQSHISKLAVSGSLGKLSNDPSRQMKNAVLVCIVLFSRAAIEGGVSPEVALTLTDRYFQSVEACRSFSELHDITVTMQNDFVERVHRVRVSSQSGPVLACCDYIQMHLEEELSQTGIAGLLRYSPSHLSHKFKQEMGISFQDYIRRQRLERSKIYLRDSGISIREISERLHFCSPSYYTESFRAVYGLSPSEWRKHKA